MSDELYDKLENENPTTNLQSYNGDRSISFTIYNNKNENESDLRLKIEHSRYIKLSNIKENNLKCVRIYFQYDNALLHVLKNKDYSKLEITMNKSIDLGPAFKDDFLTDKAIKEIKKYYKGDEIKS